MGLRTWVKRRFGKKDVQPMSYALRPDPWAAPVQTIDRVFNEETGNWSAVEESVEQNAELAERWFNSGLQKAMQGDMLGSIQDWEKAIEFKPDKHEAWSNRGILLDALGRKEEAIASYEKAIQFKPDNDGVSFRHKKKTIALSKNAIVFVDFIIADYACLG